MHIYFSGIGGTAIGPLAMIAKQAGYTVSGSDKQNSNYINYLKMHGVENIHIGQTLDAIKTAHSKNPIDWYVYSSAVSIENPNSPELLFCKENNIKTSKRDELLNKILKDKNQKLIAVAGTHGKTTTTAIAIWLFKQLNVPISYSMGAKIGFGEMGEYNPLSEYFVYECDEFDYNFLYFHPHISLITGIDYDHHEIFPTINDYQQAFRDFLSQSEKAIVWMSDISRIKLDVKLGTTAIDDNSSEIDKIKLPGLVNRQNAWQVVTALSHITNTPTDDLIKHMNSFPGLSRRFEKLADNLYTDYAHTIEKIKGCLGTAKELNQNIVVVYEPLTNRRQYYIKDDYKDLFKGVKKLYWVPSYLAREDTKMHLYTPSELIAGLTNPKLAEPAELDDTLWQNISNHLKQKDLVVVISGGGGNSLDEWTRKRLS